MHINNVTTMMSIGMIPAEIEKKKQMNAELVAGQAITNVQETIFRGNG
jgi:hypothetical protein